MRARIVLASLAAFAVGLCETTPSAFSAALSSPYNFTTINSAGGDGNFTQLLGINNAGVIAGYFGDGMVVPNNGFTVAPPYGSADFTPENFPRAFETQVTGINNNGATVGFFIDTSGISHGFVLIGSTYTIVDNPAGLTSPAFNQLLGINDHSVAAGVFLNSAGFQQAELVNLTSPTSPVFMPLTIPFEGALTSTATDVNNSGVVSGFFTTATNTEGFLLSGDTFIPLNFGNEMDTMALGLNNENEVVGSYVDAGGNTDGFVYNWVTDQLTTVNDPNANGDTSFMVEGTTVNGINDNAQIVGFYADNVNGFIGDPVPEPSTWAMMLAGFAGLGFFSHRASRRRNQSSELVTEA